MTGTSPDALCAMSIANPVELFIEGDSIICPNDFDTGARKYLAGCCDTVEIEVDSYLSKFTTAVLGDSNCDRLIGTEINVCDYMLPLFVQRVLSNGRKRMFFQVVIMLD